MLAVRSIVYSKTQNTPLLYIGPMPLNVAVIGYGEQASNMK